ncbi:MAG: hypothetical protein AMS19_13585 [Gemmatimonas sp. SG8_23]|nr:MAG: hypothetical protein AMS19_13585 [Gemmatimonas sp. SG8_23]
MTFRWHATTEATGGTTMLSHSDAGRGVVARFNDGRVLKGTTQDFAPSKPKFHLFLDGDETSEPLEVSIGALKALFFVKTWDGDSKRVDDNSFVLASGQGRRMLVTFADGEVMAGFTMGYAPHKPGFFLIPADPKSNNARVFVVKSAVTRVEFVMTSNPAFTTVASAGGP